MSSSTKRQRELARRRAERQAERRRERQARRRKRNLMAGGIFAAVLLLVVGAWLLADVFEDEDSVEPLAEPSASASADEGDATKVACGGEELKPGKKQEFDKEPKLTIDKTKKHTLSITTSCGVITAELFADKAPRTVNSFAFLASKNYFDGTECHRATTSPGLTVLQCGDPTATGSGGPGYSFADENLKGATYPRGTLAMANSGPGTNGSQFFLVAKDSQLPPNYTVWGKITPAGLAVLDKIMANGVAGGGTDGKPGQRVFIADLAVKAT